MKKSKILTMLLALSIISTVDARANDYDEYETGAVMVTTGTMTEALIEDIPSKIDIITSEQIEQMNAIDARDAMMKSNKVLVTGVGGGGVMIRGYGSGYTTVLVNGRQPSGFGLAGGGGAANVLNYIPASSIERIEILYGSAGAMYGTNTAGGVINIITKQSMIEPSVTVRSTLGTGHWTNDINMDFGKIGNFDARANLSHSKLREYQDEGRTTLGEFTNTNTGQPVYSGSYDKDSGTWQGSSIGNEFFANLEAGYDIADDHRISLFSDYYTLTSYSRNQQANINSTTGEVTSLKDLTTGSSSSRYKYSNAFVYDGTIGSNTYMLDINMARSVSNPVVGNYSINDDIDLGTVSSVYDNYGVDIRDTWFINDTNILTLGGEYDLDRADVTSTNYKGEIDRHTYAVYAQYELSMLDESLFLMPFIRFNGSDSYDSSITPQLGATYELNPNHRIKANAGMGFLAPTMEQSNGLGTSGAGATLANPNLVPETSFNYELGYQGTVELGFGVLTPSVSLYRTDFRDYITSEVVCTDLAADTYYKNLLESLGYTSHINTSGTGNSAAGTDYNAKSVSTRYNAGEAFIQGLEVEFGLAFLDDFNFDFGYRFTDAWNNTDNEETKARMVGAMHSFSGSLGYNNVAWGLSASIWGKYYMDTYRTENSANASAYYAPYYFNYFTSGFDLGKSFAENKYRITLSGENVFTSEREWENYEHVTYPKYNISFAARF